MARKGLRWINVAWLSIAASCLLGPVGCGDEDEPDTSADASPDTPRDRGQDTSVTPDVTPDRRPDGGTPDANCVGGGDAARDGVVGRALVETHRCVNCHQDEPLDAGMILSGRVGNDSGVYPKNLTPDPATGLGCWTDEQIINAFMNGVDEQGQMLCSRMPRFATGGPGGPISAENAQAIVDFLRSIPAVSKVVPQTTNCPPPPMTDAGTDARDGGAPDATPDAGPDGTTPDAGPDTTAPDAGPDSTAPDAAPDIVAPDGGPDVVTPDAGPDTATPDAGSDAAPDVGIDVDLPDAGIDIAPDTDDGASTDADNDAG